MFHWNFQVVLFLQCISYSVRKEQGELKGERILLQGIVLECCLNSTSQKRFNYTKVRNDTYNVNLSQRMNEYIGIIIHSLIPEKLSKHRMPSWFWICKQWLIFNKECPIYGMGHIYTHHHKRKYNMCVSSPSPSFGDLLMAVEFVIPS